MVPYLASYSQAGILGLMYIKYVTMNGNKAQSPIVTKERQVPIIFGKFEQSILLMLITADIKRVVYCWSINLRKQFHISFSLIHIDSLFFRKTEARISMTMKLTFTTMNIKVEPIFRMALAYGNPPISNPSVNAVDSSVS